MSDGGPKEIREIIPLTPYNEYMGDEAWQGITWTYADEQQDKEILNPWEYPPDHHRDWRPQYHETLPKRYKGYTFNQLQAHDGNKRAIEAARNLNPEKNLFIWGAAGNGKTHLAVATGHTFAKRLLVHFWSTATLFSTLRAAAGGKADKPDLLRPDLLILDDLGKVKATDFVYQEFYACLEARWADMRGTIFTANHRPSECSEQIAMDAPSAGAILSRFASGVVVEVAGEDKRIQMAEVYRGD